MTIPSFPVRIKNFISDEEVKVLSEWILDNHNEPYFKEANMGGSRKTTRYSSEEDFEYPNEVHEIRKRIIKLFKLERNEALYYIPPFKDGAVASYAPPGDTCYAHKDPMWHEGFHTVHCNIICQAPDAGGLLSLEGTEYEMKEKELFCYIVSEQEHGVTEVIGTKARLMWVFGFCVTTKQLQNFHHLEINK
jgi:hypothetical protein